MDVACRQLPGWRTGLYHFNPLDFVLERLRDGDHRDILARATAHEPHVRHAPVIVICTGTYW